MTRRRSTMTIRQESGEEKTRLSERRFRRARPGAPPAHSNPPPHPPAVSPRTGSLTLGGAQLA